MNTSELIRDPLFQLNSLLWLTQPLPTDGSFVPLFYQRGFTVHSIAPILAPPLDTLLVVKDKSIHANDRARPDVILKNDEQLKYAFVECKKESFSVSSSTAEQTRTLLLVSGRTADVLGLQPAQVNESCLAFTLPEDCRVKFHRTINELRNELEDQSLSAGDTSIIGLNATDNQCSIDIDEYRSGFFGLPIGRTTYSIFDDDTDPRPLYFIPYDPDVDQTQEERMFCRRILFERMLSAVISAYGRTPPPTTIILKTESILNDAMFGMYLNWENRESAKHLRRLCKMFFNSLMQTVNQTASGAVVYDAEKGWKIESRDHQHQDNVLDLLSRFSCETLSVQNPQDSDLFEDVEV